MRYYKARYGVLNIIVKAEDQAGALKQAMDRFKFREGAITIVPATEKEIKKEQRYAGRI